ncbi:PREDICTED: uncharacterized protein LOC101300888 isoform 2 [Fragaria vesca subsp. vesca]
MAFSSMRNLARSGVSLPLLRTQFERTQLERTQFVRSFWKGSRGRLEKGMQEKLKYLIDQGVKIEMVEDKNQPVGKYTLEMHPYTMELTLRESGLLASLYKHGPNDTWRAVAQRIKGKTTRSVYELKTVETRLDEIRALAKEISTVLIVYQKQKKTALQPKDNRTEVLPHDFGSILIKLSQLRLKWKAIASLESATLLDDSEMDELVEIEATIKEVHNIVVVQQLLEKDV